MEVLKQGAYFYKHDYGRNKRGRKWLVLSNDGLQLKWRSVGATEVVQPGDGGQSSRNSGSSSARYACTGQPWRELGRQAAAPSEELAVAVRTTKCCC